MLYLKKAKVFSEGLTLYNIHFCEGVFAMDKRFKKNEFVVYGKNGVCEIEDIRIMNFAGQREEYYILRPKSSRASTVYVPVNKDELVARMRFIITSKQANEILTSVSGEMVEWIDDKGLRLEQFNSIVSSGDIREIILLIICMRKKRAEKESQNKHLSSTDENILRLAEELVEEELSLALDCSAESALEYLNNKID